MLPVCSLDCVTGTRRLPPQPTQRAFSGFGLERQVWFPGTEPVCNFRHELFLKSSTGRGRAGQGRAIGVQGGDLWVQYWAPLAEPAQRAWGPGLDQQGWCLRRRQRSWSRSASRGLPLLWAHSYVVVATHLQYCLTVVAACVATQLSTSDPATVPEGLQNLPAAGGGQHPIPDAWPWMAVPARQTAPSRVYLSLHDSQEGKWPRLAWTQLDQKLGAYNSI
jgi:hypothetical protein